MAPRSSVVVIGAGPYGLSIAAFLKAHGVDFRVFGSPMATWRTQMPKGMQLKSDGFASDLYEPGAEFTLAHFCAERGIPYQDIGLPVALETFSAYGMEFQQRYVPELEDKVVVSLRQATTGFEITLEDGESLESDHVVLASGISHFQFTPPVLRELPKEFVSHASDNPDLSGYSGKDVAVVGAGASALDTAAILMQVGASPQIVARRPRIQFHAAPKLPRTLLDQLRAPTSGLGPSWRSRLCTDAPLVFHAMPERFRFEVVRRHLGAAPGWFIRDQVEGKMPFHLGTCIERATVEDGRVSLTATGADGWTVRITCDHVIAGTGYKVDLNRLAFLDAALRDRVRMAGGQPALSSRFQSSVSGLYFVGAASANAFGPLVRFAFGARFTAARLTAHLARVAAQRGAARSGAVASPGSMPPLGLADAA